MLFSLTGRFTKISSEHTSLNSVNVINVSNAILMKGTVVPNPWRITACYCSCVLTRPSRDSLMLAMRILFCSCLCKVRSRISYALSQALCNLSLAFLTDFTLSDSTPLISFIAFSPVLCFSFGSKDMIIAFTCFPSYRHSSFTLRAYLCILPWPIIDLAITSLPRTKRPLAT